MAFHVRMILIISTKAGISMAMIKCKDCGSEISDASKTCPNCGCPTSKSIKAEKQRQAEEQWSKMSPKEKRTSTLIGIIILAVAVIFLLKMCNGPSSSAGAGYSGNDYNTSTNAKVCARKAVEDSLKAPSTASFCSYTEMNATNLGGDKWMVTGYVDAQNSFGAMVRQYWSVTLILTKTGFKLVSVSSS